MGRRRLGFWQWFAVVLIKPVMKVWTRRTWRGMEHLRQDGPAIIVANHISHADPLVSAHFIYEAGRWPQFLGKASVFKVPVIGWILHRCRQIPVERGSVDAARSLDALVKALAAGGAVVIYPEGTTSREPNLWPMRGKTGAARLALATGAPVIPLVMWGPERLFDPRRARLNPRPRIPVTVVAGPPIELSRWAGSAPTRQVLEEMTDVIMLRLRDMLAEIRGGTPPPLWQRGGRSGAESQPPGSGA
ncbi:lysophospholipid acyltransferase family protein [Micromonospora endophytica]|uniref:1-acyl-sn-glycerol-3-phosphate acyltransferase n=1 Tax=Micromonospora endophytica TaxID=515350 RepID=A0A2W2DJP5_9ACTN|nr:lysophospholipid acyltransferase family protein [Micromonospora endophytica]PZF97416.1 1-acyl-sn-glycerol-3-phosphate acyltransferase [Micromonospora endophytica]RIW45036.1 1-acyl-sn-glycerol-3-phosphate acyltransferase [Micromonospora endophytica]BCJ57997.1 1-acyl-sn-glycerol-3-phosphate acyltransferase [Micromonospora endophytica]